MKKLIIALLSVVLVFEISIHLTGFDYLNTALFHNFPDIEDYTLFENRIIQAKSPDPYPQVFLNTTPPPKIVDELETTALAVIRRDTVVYLNESDFYDEYPLSNSFSMAKSYISVLIGCAIQDSSIQSINDPVGKYLPGYPFSNNKELTIKSLLTMSSGLSWDESYQGPFSITTKAYYGDNIDELIKTLEVVEEPSKEFKYLSGNTQILAMILKEATGKTVSDYLSEKLWTPLGCTSDALWSIDHKGGMEKAYCCINSRALDFAKLGSLFLNKGKWKSEQIIPEWYYEESITPAELNDGDGQPIDFYGYQWWIKPDYKGNYVYYARGILGQFIIVIPEKELVIVRLGKKRGERGNDWHFPISYQLIDWAIANF